MPTNPPNLGQILLLAGAVALFLFSFVISLMVVGHTPGNTLRLAEKSSIYWALCLGIAALVWHAFSQRTVMPPGDNFASLAAVGLLLAGFILYVQRIRPIPGLDLFLLPIVLLMLISAIVFGRIKPGSYHPDSLWFWAHDLSNYGGALAFAIAAAVGGMYLVASKRLRKKPPLQGPQMGSLERLEKITHSAGALGFALLTVGMATGLIRIAHAGGNTQLGPHWLASPKVILAFGVWIIYALALHTPISPALRGRKSAMLSIIGFVLMFGTIVAVQFMPGGK